MFYRNGFLLRTRKGEREWSMNIKKIEYKNKGTVWMVRYYLHGRGSKRVQRSFATKSLAQAFLEERVLEKKTFQDGPSSLKSLEETTFGEEATYWLTLQRSKFSSGHAKRAEGTLKKLSGYGLNRKLLKDFHPGFLSKLQYQLLTAGLKAASVNRDLEFVTAILSFSTKQRRIPYNPSIGFEKLKEIRNDIQSWDQQEAQSFLSFAENRYPPNSDKRWIYAVYLLCLNTGLRAGEIWGLQPKDLKFDQNLIHIERQYDRVSQTLSHTKGKENRSVPCNQVLIQELKTILFRRKGNVQTLFYSETDQPIDHDNFRNRFFEKDVKAWGGKKVRFHDLRHTAITLMVGQGLDLKTVQSIAGHKDIQTTMRYVHLLAERIQHAAKHFAVKPVEIKPKLYLVD